VIGLGVIDREGGGSFGYVILKRMWNTEGGDKNWNGGGMIRGIYECRECLVGGKNLKEKEKTMNENSIFSSLAF
jgi:hypothetical protein